MAIADKFCPLRQYFDRRFPHIGPVQADYRASSGPLLVEGSTANPGTLGGAFGFLMRFTLDADYRPQVAVAHPAISGTPNYLSEVLKVARLASGAAHRPLPEQAVATVIRASWALALCTQLYRNPYTFPTSPLAGLIRDGRFTADTLLTLAPDEAVVQLRALYMLAITELWELLLSAPPSAVALGPTFTASRFCRADADIIVDGVLLELKTRLGTAKKSRRADALSLADIYQMIGYALFDTTDTFRIHTIALYSARYGVLHRWPLQQLLDTLADEPTDLATERANVLKLLSSQHGLTA
ncbi:hypothetical protein [Nocardia sp. CY41]|uniref:hypothetical protein n=1 Tax=Nocardia sp. CY41 TaxID=2608686 RepID=UPI00135B495F|nr:hypothetical protein [Nocardia sp. CY41]